MNDKPAPRSPADRIRTLAQAAFNADQTVDQVDHVLDDLQTSLEGLNKAVVKMEGSLDYFDETLKRLNASLEQLESMMGRVLRMVDVAETAIAPVAATESAVRGVLNVFRPKR